ncbi:MAG: cyclic nucleotide-binding domain-containing protein [Anaerolineales bacterium]
MDQPTIYSTLKGHYLFQSLQDQELQHITRLFKPVTLQKGEVLYRRGQTGRNFFIVVSGEITLHFGEGKKTSVGWREHFGEEALLSRQPRMASARAAEQTTLLSLQDRAFHSLLETFPAIERTLVAINNSDSLARARSFSWIGEKEEIRFIDRKHVITFYTRLILPFLLALLSSAGIVVLNLNPFLFAPLSFLFYGCWVLWLWLDWGNDYYLVTSERVVWVEKVIWLRDQRREVPLGSVLTVNISTHQLQRLIGYGDVIVRTYTGNMPMKNAGHPAVLAALIQEAHYVAAERYKRTEAAKIDETLRERLKEEAGGKPPSSFAQDQLPAEDGPLPETSESMSYFQQFLNLFRARYEWNDIITYRKHKFVLFLRAWWLLITFLTLLVAFFARMVNLILSPSLALLSILLTVNALILVYIFADWANDRFQLTKNQVIDIDRKPLGRETKRSALLENILSLDYKRDNILQRLFNYGTVAINVGDIQLDFENVAKPKLVQNEIFEYYNTALKRKEQEQAERHRDDMVEFLAAYHRQRADAEDTGEEINPVD